MQFVKIAHALAADFNMRRALRMHGLAMRLRRHDLCSQRDILHHALHLQQVYSGGFAAIYCSRKVRAFFGAPSAPLL